MTLASALLAKLTGALVAIALCSVATVWLRGKFSDKADGEPLLTEEALVHAKSDHGTEYDHIYIIHFYIASRDTVVNCEVPYEIWRDLEMKTRGTLTHQGGRFYSFETKDAMYCEESLYALDARY